MLYPRSWCAQEGIYIAYVLKWTSDGYTGLQILLLSRIEFTAAG